VFKDFLSRFRKQIEDAVAQGRPVRTTVRGLPVEVINTRPDIATTYVLERLDAALGLIERYTPWHFRRFKRDFAQIWVRRYPCRGAYLPEQRVCLVELTFTVNPDFSPSQVAATILHEGMHARLDRCGIQHTPQNAARHERFCRRAEVEFGKLVPDGAPVLERALGTLGVSDEDVAPVIDWEVAAKRVAEVDRRALGRED
jgi:hypothetical protein